MAVEEIPTQPNGEEPVQEKPKKKHPGGRPSKINKVNLSQLTAMAELGLTEVQIAKVIGISEATITTYKKKYPKFLAALKDGKAVADNLVEKSLFERARGYSHDSEEIFCSKDGLVTRVPTIKHYPPDATSMIFWLKNRRPKVWRDKQDIEHTGDVLNLNVQIEQKMIGYLDQHPELRDHFRVMAKQLKNGKTEPK